MKDSKSKIERIIEATEKDLASTKKKLEDCQKRVADLEKNLTELRKIQQRYASAEADLEKLLGADQIRTDETHAGSH
jgi:uncharacterized protein involved in exopolysaccharide biosynthesis